MTRMPGRPRKTSTKMMAKPRTGVKTGPLQAAQDGQDQPEDEHEDLGQQEEHHVPPEAREDLGGRSRRHVGVEEGLLDAWPGGQVDDDVAKHAHHEQRADDGHDDSPASLLGVAEES